MWFRDNRVFLGSMLLLMVISGGCNTVFPPASFDWGHGARPLDKGDVRTQFGGGAGGAAVVAPLLFVDKETEWADDLERGVSPFGVAGGIGGGTELQLNEKMMLRGDLSLGAEWSFASLKPAMVLAGYIGTQYNITNNVAARARLGLGGVAFTYLPSSGYVGGEAGLVWSFWSNQDSEAWLYGYTNGRVGNGYIPLTPPGDVPWFSFNRLYQEWGLMPVDSLSRYVGGGLSAGYSRQLSDTMSVYASTRSDVTMILLSANENTSLAGQSLGVLYGSLGVQTGLTWRF